MSWTKILLYGILIIVALGVVSMALISLAPYIAFLFVIWVIYQFTK